MAEYFFGDIDHRQLHLRTMTPLAMQCWNGSSWVFSWRRLFRLASWWSAIRSRSNWQVWCRYYGSMNHRCWCCEGTSCDGVIMLAGFGVRWFYSNYTGEVPCVCDRALSESQEGGNDE